MLVKPRGASWRVDVCRVVSCHYNRVCISLLSLSFNIVLVIDSFLLIIFILYSDFSFSIKLIVHSPLKFVVSIFQKEKF